MHTIKQMGVDRAASAGQKEGLVFPPSVQSDLFSYLKKEQEEFVKPILRVLKKKAQEELCCALLDYLESGDAIPPQDFTLGALFFYITRSGGGFKDEPENRKILRPLHCLTHVPMNMLKH